MKLCPACKDGYRENYCETCNNEGYVSEEVRQRMLTNVWRESYMRLFKTLEQAQTDRDLYQRQAERLADVLDNLIIQLSCFITLPPAVKQAEHEAREALEEYKLAQ